jgi:hypothetical protein
MHELIQAKTPQERFAMGLSMCATSRILVKQAILRENPNISPLDFKKELFLKYYGNEFTKEQKEEFFRMLESRQHHDFLS